MMYFVQGKKNGLRHVTHSLQLYLINIYVKTTV